MRRIAFAVLIALIAVSAVAQQELPPGKWWRRADIVQSLSLAEDQQNRLETIFRGSANDLIDTRAEIEKATIALRGELDQQQLDRTKIKKIAQQLNEARARKFDRELMMLVDMRAVLSDQQWNQMRNALDRLQRRPEQPMRRPEQPMRRPEQPMRRPGAKPRQ